MSVRAATLPRTRSSRGAELIDNLRAMERGREAYWLSQPARTAETRLAWRAHAARHALHIAPGETVLDVGAGSGLWTERLMQVLHDDTVVVACAFNEHLAEQARARALPGVGVLHVESLDDLPAESFDHVLCNTIASNDRFDEHIRWLFKLLRPAGRLLLFEANHRNPQVFLKARSRRFAERSGNVPCQISLRAGEWAAALRTAGFKQVEVAPYDIIHPRTPPGLVPALQASAFVLEQVPGVRALCGTLLVTAEKPGERADVRPTPGLARHSELHGSVSVVVPCHNEAMNVKPLVSELVAAYDAYLHEIVLVDDNSTDDTSAVIRELASTEPRVRLIERDPPGGVGLALRDGYRAATGRYILTMDCDFTMLVRELADLFDAVGAGHDGAIGSRFSHESVLLNYPPAKLLGNRAFHVLLRLLTRRRVRDVSNNLKLYRAEILKDIEISEPGFAANAETGLRPLLAGYDIVEVPIAWINRDEGMGVSSFKVLSVAPGYARALARMLRAGRQDRRSRGKRQE